MIDKELRGLRVNRVARAMKDNYLGEPPADSVITSCAADAVDCLFDENGTVRCVECGGRPVARSRCETCYKRWRRHKKAKASSD